MEDVFLYYKKIDKLYCVVAKHEGEEGFLITAYPTDKVIVYYHKETDTMDIWFGNPEDEYICEEVREEIILKKNKDGKVIGIEKLYVSKTLGLKRALSVGVVVT